MPRAAGLWYEWHGPEDGKVLILSPGLGGSASYWAPNLAALSREYRVLTYDHRGTGRSDPVLSHRVAIHAMAEDVLALTKALQISGAHFVGHALGGLIGLELALRFPVVDKLVIVNGWATLDPHTARCFDARLELLRNSGPEAYVRAQPIFLYPAGWSSEHSDTLDAEAALQLDHFPEPETIERRVAAARAFDLWFDMPAADILVLAAADDILVPSLCSEALAKELCGRVELATMAWGGHACNVTDPDTFNRLVLEFLRS